jgi:hypothetical protein
MTDEELLLDAVCHDTDFVRRTRTMEDFRYDEQQEKYWDTTTGNLLGGRSVDGAVPKRLWLEVQKGEKTDKVPPSVAINNIDTGLTVEGSTWWPGLPRFINNIVVSERGAMPLKGAVCYNSYLPPVRDPCVPDIDPEPWLAHVRKLYPDPVEHEHFFDFCAHMIQHPEEKVNHGLVMAGAQGIGKDTALIPVRRGVGEWNAAEVGPDAITSQYNGHVKSVLLVINEVRPHDEEFKANNFYNLLKPLLASPPEMLPMTVKYANTIYVRNLCHVILTTNDPLSMYIPAEDRRLFVMSSGLSDPKTSGAFAPDYFDKLYDWLGSGGTEAVIHWLSQREVSRKTLHAAPPVTKGKTAIIESAAQVRRTQADDVWDDFCTSVYGGVRPQVVFHRDLTDFASAESFDDQSRQIAALSAKGFHFKMSERGYDMIRNPNGSEWKSGKFRSRTAFALRELSRDEQMRLILEALADRAEKMKGGK